MKLKFFFAVIALAIIVNAAPVAAQWIQQSARPQPRSLSGIEWVSADHAFIAGSSMTLMETLDGGATWRKINLTAGNTTSPLYNVYFKDTNNGFAFGNSSTTGPDVYSTIDGGQNWTRVTSFPLGGSWRQMDFVSANIGFMGANGSIVRTMDGGATWQIRADYTNSPVVYGMDFRDKNVGLIGGTLVPPSGGATNPGIFKTTDGGATWVRKYTQSANDVVWLNDTTAVAASASILRSTDAGETWSVLSNDIATGLDDLELLPDGTLVGVSATGNAWRRTNGGANWTQTLRGLGALPADWAVGFFDNQTGAIVGQGGFIYKTTDGGATWKMLNSGIGGVEFMDIEMFNDADGLAVGSNGYFVRTSNGGNFWETDRLFVTGVVLFRNENLQAVSIVDSDFAVAAGHDGVVYKTFDKGLTWQSIGFPNLPGEYFINDVKFVNRNVGYVTGNRPYIAQSTYKTIDGGASWQLLNLNIGHTIDFIGENKGWIVNAGGSGYRTEDGGATWQQMILPNQGFSPTISKIDFINENEGWAIGWYGYAAHTIDGGRTWQLENIAADDQHILGLHVLSPNEAFAVGVYANQGPVYLYHTNDAGATWRKFAMPVQYSLSGVFASPSRKIWASGYDGEILNNQNFTASAPALLLTVNPTRAPGGNTVQGVVSIASPAPEGGTVVNLSSANTSLVTVPSSVTIPAGATEARFAVSTQTVSATQPAPRITLTASKPGNTDTAVLVLAPRTNSKSNFDFDGDGKADISIFRPSSGEWWISKSSNGGNYAAQFGNSNDKIVPADFTGDGKTDVAIFRPSTGEWFVIRSQDGSFYSFPFGASGDIPAPADFDGDGKADAAVFRPLNSTWYITKSSGGTTTQQFGANGDVPVPADYDADGKADIAVYCVARGEWWLNRSTAGLIAYQFGNSSDKPVAGDYTGDGKADLAVFRPTTREWFVLRSENTSYFSFPFGADGDLPAPADYDGDGKTDAAVFRSSNSAWFVLKSTGGNLIQTFGQSGDNPVPAAFVP
jgi:photosystem II stability/assembly factor-like uncharacterized protein